MTPEERAATAVREGRASRKALRAAIAREIRAAAAEAAPRPAEVEALRESEARFRAFAERASDVFWVLEFDLHFSYVSPSVLQLRGYTPEEVCRQRLEEIFTPPSLRLLSETLQAQNALDPNHVVDRDISKTLELEQYVKGGATVWTEAKAFYKLDARGHPTAIIGVTRNIDARKRAEERLRQSERQYRATLDAMGDAIHVLDADLRFVLANQALVEWNRELGLETNVLSRTVPEIFPFLPAGIHEEYRQVFRTGEVLVTEECTSVGGKEYFTETRKIPVSEGGAVTRVLTVIRDVSHRKRAEEALRQREEEFRHLFNSTSDAVVVTDWNPEGFSRRLMAVNDVACEWTGRTREALLSTPPGEFLPAEYHDRRVRAREALKHNGAALYETEVLLADGQRRPVEIHDRLITFRGQQAVLCALRDITNRRQTERELRDAHDQLELRVAERTRELQQALAELRAKTEERERIARALRESEERLRSQYQGIPIPTYTWQRSGEELILVDYNEAANRIVAGRMAEWKGRKASEMYAARPDLVADLWQCYRERVTIKRELVYRFQTTNQDRVLSTTYAFTAPDQVLVHVEDVTERVRAEEALRASEARWKAQFKGLPLPTYTWQKVGEEFLLTEYNDAAVEITKGRISEWVGIRAAELYRDQPGILEDIARCFRERSTSRREMLYHYRSTGESRFLTVTYAFVPPDLVLVHTDDITERKRAEQALRESEARFRGLVECLPAMVYTAQLDPASTTQYISPQVEQLVGYTPADYRADPDLWRRILHPEDRERVLAEVRRCHATAEPFDVEYRLIARDGRVKWFHDSAVIVKDAQDRPLGLQGVMYDITQHRQAEEAVRESEARYRSLIECLPGIAFILDVEKQIAVRYVSPQVERLMGFTPAEVEGNPELWLAQVHPDDRPWLLKEIERCRATGAPFAGEFRMLTRERAAKWFHTTAVMIQSSAGRPQAFQGVMYETTERKQAEQALRESEERFRALFEQAADIILLLEVPPGGIPIIRDANAAASRLLGYERDELLGQPISFIEGEPQAADQIRERRRRISSGEMNVFEAKHRRKNGTVFEVECSIKEIQVGPKTLAFSIERDITERKRAEQALRESEERYRTLIQTSPDAILMIGPDNHILVANQQAARLHGFPSVEAMHGVDAFELIAPKDRPSFYSQLGRLLREGTLREVEYSFRRLDGSVFPGEMSASVLRDKDGRPQAVLGVGRDIAERKRAESALRASEERYRMLVETSPDAIILVGPDGRILLANQQTVRMHGFARAEDMVGLSAAQLVAPEERERSREDLRRLPETGTLRGVQRTFVRKDGSPFPVEISLSAVVDADGRPLAFLGVGRDITARKQAEQALRESEERYRTLVETSPDGIVMIGLDHRVLLANPQIARMHGFASSEELRGLDVLDLVAPQDHDEARAALQRLPERGTRRNVRCTLRRRDGTRFPAEVSLSVVAGTDRRPLAFLCLSRDITEQRKIEVRERLQREQLRQADKLAALGTLVSGVAHEVSNPNHVITLNTNTLRSLIPGLQSVLDAKAREHGDFLIGRLPYSQLRDETPRLLDDILGASNRIKRIVSDLKTYARPDTSEPVLPFEANAAVTAAVELLRPLLQKSTRRFSMDLAHDLPRVPGRGPRVEQVVVNLLQNACQALRGPENAIRVSTHRSADGSHVLIEVRDEGEGIPPENLARLTDPFFTTKRDSGGTGLGLAVSAGIAQEHRGRLEFESAPGQGTTARLWLPISPARGEEGDLTAGERAPATREGP